MAEVRWRGSGNSVLLACLTTKWSKKVARGKRVSAPPLVTRAECPHPEGVRRNPKSSVIPISMHPFRAHEILHNLIQERRSAGSRLPFDATSALDCSRLKK